MTHPPPRIGVVGVPGRWSSEHLADVLEARTGFRLLVDMADVCVDLSSGLVTASGLDLGGLDGLIVKKISESYSPDILDRLELLRCLEHRGVRVFSRPERMLRLLNRLSCTLSLRFGGLPLPPTVITESAARAAEAVERFGLAVAKPLYTSKARGMRLLRPGPGLRGELEAYRNQGHPVFYLQKFLDLDGRDFGAVFLGGDYLATYSRIGGGDSWNTTTRSGGRYACAAVPDDLVALARKAQDLFGLDFTCVDLAVTDDGPCVFEVSTFGGFRGLKEGCGMDAAELYADYALRSLGHG